MRKFIFLVIGLLIKAQPVSAFDVKSLANNKEMRSREMSKRESGSALAWKNYHPLKSELKERSLHTLSESFNELEVQDSYCDLGVVKLLISAAKKNLVIDSDDEFLSFIGYLREDDLIDDVLYKLLNDLYPVSVEMEQTPYLFARPLNLYTAENSKIDLVKLYAPVKKWPDDVSSCSLDSYWLVASGLKVKNAKDRDAQMKKLNRIAYEKEVVSKEVYYKLETLRKLEVLDYPVYLRRYVDIVKNAKDKLTTKIEESATNDFSVEYVSRKHRLTQRGNLYRTYTSTQVMMLAQIIEKTARRMDAWQVSMTWQFEKDPEAGTEVYVLSPMEQYRLAIKMLRKDLGELARSEAFAQSGLQYEHLIAAAYETGYIKSEELDQILKFEDFWNPKVPKWKAYASFAFSIAGTASLYLPPPWNIIGAVALVLTQTAIVNGDKKPDPDDNWNVVI